MYTYRIDLDMIQLDAKEGLRRELSRVGLRVMTQNKSKQGVCKKRFKMQNLVIYIPDL